MKKASLLFAPVGLILLSLLIFSFSSNLKEQDSKLIGVWKGFEVEKQIEGVEKHWIQQRFENGTYVIMFTTKQDCQIETFTEKGKWWTEKGKFYELSSNAKDPEIYIYNVKNEDEVVDFKSVKMSGEKNESYTFSDYKISF
ncbi:MULTISPECIES: hypothetical protein [Flavobacterium]|uniref:Lipocalin-like domain-containing protein n=2 Tax=Flavobacterium TaxID=237 RepID=A0A6V6ZCG2_9FLAO|nr:MULTISPECIES: hypothetical protein [Flavobacterium]OOV20685.1 hypothetical protein BXU10_01455 [Flavobacterium sp. LM4]CAD0008429.1 hypothetical protein FLAT13_04383 [Flavobacterium salmonis]CAD0009315.1 hypothetical protein FLACHUCJ7_04205 [Flavobacterium chungangense]